MKNGYEYLKNTAQFGLDIVDSYKSSDNELFKNNALFNLLAIEDILDRNRDYCSDSEQIQEINILMDKIRIEISHIRDADIESFKNLVTRNCDRLKSQF